MRCTRHPPAPSCPLIGVGLRRPHIAQVLAERPAVDFFEVHPENYVLDRSELGKLEAVRRDYALSLHGVGLSLGSADGISEDHLARLRALVGRLDPFLVSDHLSWSSVDGIHLNDLLPFPYSEETLAVFARNVNRVQDALGRRILVENPSAYVQFADSKISEPDFLRALVERTGCGLLLDVNNVFVSAANLGFDAAAYLTDIPYGAVAEIHVAGHRANIVDGRTILIDDHGSPVSEPVWDLYAQVIGKARDAATLIEWDSDLPSLDLLLDQHETARTHARHATAPAAPTSLHRLQAEMAMALLGAEPNAHALPLSGHLSIYRNNVRQSLLAALSTAFPAVMTLVGEDFFRQIAERFIEINPPRQPYVTGYGAEFGNFLDAFPACGAVPYLADIARLEWVASRVCLADPAPALTPTLLALRAKAGTECLCFEPQPSIRHLESPYPIDTIWDFARAPDGDAEPPSLAAGPVRLEVVNDGEGVVLRRLDEPTFRFRATLFEGADLGTAADAALGCDPRFDLGAALRRALDDGIFTDCHATQFQDEESSSCQC